MGRNLRTGYNYRCYDDTNTWNQSFAENNNGSNNNTPNDLNTPRSCPNGKAIVFEAAQGNTPFTTPPDPNAADQWAYKLESNDGGFTYNIFKSTTGGGTPISPDWVQLNPPEVSLSRISGFSVLGAEPIATDSQQPFVTIRLVGKITFKPGTSNSFETPFSLQTSVSQRVIDI